MKFQLRHYCVVAAFAVLMGQMAWRTLGPAVIPDYRIKGNFAAMSGPDPSAKILHLRREMYVQGQVHSAWLEVVAQGRFRLIVNGSSFPSSSANAHDDAGVVDLTRALKEGLNIIAITCAQTRFAEFPAVHVKGQVVAGDQTIDLGPDDQWRCAHVSSRNAYAWFEPDFDDQSWSPPQIRKLDLNGKTVAPPRSVTRSVTGPWITPGESSDGSASLTRSFACETRPKNGWLRLSATGCYRLAINGVVIDVQEKQIGTALPVSSPLRTYDVTTLLRKGINTVALLLDRTHASVHVLADFEAEFSSGEFQSWSGADGWLFKPGVAPDWLHPNLADSTQWKPCDIVSDNLGTPPWLLPRSNASITLPWPTKFIRGALQTSLTALIGILALICTRTVAAELHLRQPENEAGSVMDLACLAMVIPTFGIAAAVFATHDYPIGPQDIYRIEWLAIAAALAPLQWLILIPTCRIANPVPTPTQTHSDERATPSWMRWALAGLVIFAFLLRLDDTLDEPLNPDEVGAYLTTQGIFERGFPSVIVHEDIPPLYVATSELIHYGMALCELVFDHPNYVTRFPGVCYAAATVWLIFVVGRYFFNANVAMIASVLYVFAPTCRDMANFGRYFTAVELFTLATIYWYHKTLQGSGPINRRALWMTTLFFLCMYLCWQGSALCALSLIAAALLHRRGYIRPLLTTPAIYAAMAIVAAVMAVHTSHRTQQQTARLWYGGGAEDVSITLMTEYPGFDVLYYVVESSWNHRALIPMIGVFGAGLLCLRHRFRRSTRFLLTILLVTCFTESFLLPMRAPRYVYFLTPMTILLASATIFALAEWLSGFFGSVWTRFSPRLLARSAGLCAVVIPVALGSGVVVQPEELGLLDAQGNAPIDLGFPDHMAGIAYLKNHLQPGDVVMAITPHGVDYQLEQRCDYWPQTKLHLQAVLDDNRSVPLHRAAGNVMVTNMDDLRDVFARNDRIWYITSPGFHGRLNRSDAGKFLREHMDVVYEDFSSVLLLHDDLHRPAFLRAMNEAALDKANAMFLP